MRIIAAIIICVIIFASVTAFQSHIGNLQVLAREHEPEALAVSEQVYSLAITPTFQAVADPFALADGSQSSLMRVTLGGVELLNLDTAPAVGEQIIINNLHGVLIGKNEIYIEAFPPVGPRPQRHSLLAELFCNGVLVASESIWSPPGAKVAGVLRFETTESEARHD